MAGMAGMDLLGEKEVRRMLNALGPRIERKVTRQAMVKAARPIITAARANCKRVVGRRSAARLTTLYERKMAKPKKKLLHPRRKGRVSRERTRKQSTQENQLARSIGHRIKTYTSVGVVFVAVGPKWPQGAHGHLIEYGHQPSGWYAKQKGAKFVAAKPFMRLAFDSHKRAALTIVIQEHRARVEREAQKASYHARAAASRFGGRGYSTGVTWQQVVASEAGG